MGAVSHLELYRPGRWEAGEWLPSTPLCLGCLTTAERLELRSRLALEAAAWRRQETLPRCIDVPLD